MATLPLGTRQGGSRLANFFERVGLSGLLPDLLLNHAIGQGRKLVA